MILRVSLLYLVLISFVSSIEVKNQPENLIEEVQGINKEQVLANSISDPQWESGNVQPEASVAVKRSKPKENLKKRSKQAPTTTTTTTAATESPVNKSVEVPSKPDQDRAIRGSHKEEKALPKSVDRESENLYSDLDIEPRTVPEAIEKSPVAGPDHGVEIKNPELDFETHETPPESLSGELKPHEPLEGVSTNEGVMFKADSDPLPPGKPIEVPEMPEEDKEKRKEKEATQQPFALFTIAHTNINTPYEQLPYREKYQWQNRKAPCHSFDLKVPDELAEKSMITLCIFRPNLEFADEPNKKLIMNNDDADRDPIHNVLGHVMKVQESSVYGRVKNGNFYGEVSVIDKDKNIPTVFVVEEINLLSRLMRHNPKTLDHLLMVMHNAPDNASQDHVTHNKSIVYNAVVTKGASLINFMMYTNTYSVNRNPFLMFSTSHNSYISAGEPTMQVDDRGQIRLETGRHIISVDTEGFIRISIPGKQYTFRPNGRTIVKEGMSMRTLQEHEGSVAITAYSASSIYDCVLPTPAFHRTGKGGYVCKVCLAMDDSFREHYIEKVLPKGETDTARLYLGHIIDQVSWIFRAMDLNGDSHPDNIGLDYESQALHWTYPDAGGEDVTEKELEVLFQSLESHNFADCCLGIGFTMKNFPKDALGKRTLVQSGPSGVCTGRTGRVASNLIIMTANNKRGNFGTVTEKQLVYATANQIASAFGANPDGTGNDDCDQFNDEHQNTRHHLMWPDVMRNTTLAEQSLSTCSKADIFRTLSTCISSCFDIDKHPFCGNGIVEKGEECDCGSENNCLLQTCCYSRTGKHPCRKTGTGCTSGVSPSYTFATPVMLLAILTLVLNTWSSTY